MNIIIKTGADNYFKKKLSQGAFAKDDLLFCKSKNGVSEAFYPGNVFIIKNKFSILRQLISISRKQKIKYIQYISDNMPSLFKKIAFAMLAFFCSANFNFDINGTSESYNILNALYDLIKLLFSPMISIVFIPNFFFKEVLKNFLLPRENKNKPFISVGKNARLFGVIYWYSFAKRAKKHGLFGYAFDEYMGVPVSLFHFPLAIFILLKLRFRAVYMIGFLMLVGSIFGIYHAWTGLSLTILLFIIFLLMMSNVLWEHAALGVYEILAWGFGVLGFMFFIFGQEVIAGVPLGLAVLSHLGVATLVCLFLCVYSILQFSFYNLVITGVVAFFISAYWFLPYFLQRKRLTRMQMINEEWEYKYRFGYLRLIQFFVYLAFVISLYLFAKDIGLLVLATLPLGVAYINARIKWIFSPYTVRMFQAFVGMICLSQAFNVYSLIFILYFLYLSPKLLSWENHDDNFYYNLVLKPRDDLINKAEEFFSSLKRVDRVGFELGSKESGRTLDHEMLITFFSYFLSDKDCEVFNTGMTELVKFDLYKRTCSKFNSAASCDELLEAISTSSLTTIVAFSASFKKMLDENKFCRKKKVRFRLSFKSRITDIEAVLYSVPFINERAVPKADIQVGKCCLNMKFPAKGDYTLKYSYDPGLVCWQGSTKLELMDNGEGMILIKDAKPGEAVIRYSHNRLFLQCKKN